MKKIVAVLISLMMILGASVGVFAEESAVRVGLYCPVDAGKGASEADVLALADAIRLTGNEVVILEKPADEQAAAAGLEGVDCLVFCTGESITDTACAFADAAETMLLRAAIVREMPLLAIDRGMLALNEVLGGTTATELPTGTAADADVPDTVRRNAIVFDEESYMGMVLGGMGSFEVNAAHNARVETLAKGLVVTAVSEDGAIEAFQQDDSGTFMMMGVQFRPERMLSDGQFLGFFSLLTDCAEINKNAAYAEESVTEAAAATDSDPLTEILTAAVELRNGLKAMGIDLKEELGTVRTILRDDFGTLRTLYDEAEPVLKQAIKELFE